MAKTGNFFKTKNTFKRGDIVEYITLGHPGIFPRWAPESWKRLKILEPMYEEGSPPRPEFIIGYFVAISGQPRREWFYIDNLRRVSSFSVSKFCIEFNLYV